jgi:hypothetical protein
MIRSNMETSIDWLIAANVSQAEIERILEKEKRAKEVCDCYEKSMGYNPLPWGKLESLKKFLMTKSTDEIKQFAYWSRKEFSTFTPAKARQYPEMVKDLWPQAFPTEHKIDVTGAVDAFLNRR